MSFSKRFCRNSPFKKDVKMYDGSGQEVTVDDTSLGTEYLDDNGNKARDWNYTNKKGKKGTDVLYSKPPRGPSKWESKKPTRRIPPIEQNPSA